jgi:hypothetical protein
MNRYKLFEKKTKQELIEMITVEKDPKKHTEIAHTINFHIIEEKKANGNYIQPDGYSGRQTKRNIG